MKTPRHSSAHSLRETPASDDLPIVIVRTRPIGTMPFDRRACESLGSWVYRLQKANAITRPGVIRIAAGLRNHLLIDVPTDPERAAHAWARVSGRSEEEISPMWLSLEDRPTPGRSGQTVMRAWTLAEKTGTSTYFRARHVVCPDCLAQDHVPYWRQSWRLATTVMCDVHRRNLVDRCPRCKGTFAAPRPILLPLSHCGNCGFDLRNCSPDVAPLHTGLLQQTLYKIYRRKAKEHRPLHVLPCLPLRRLLNQACAASADVTSMEAFASLRAEAGLEKCTRAKFSEQFVYQTIEVRSRAARLLEDFATRRPSDFERLVHGKAYGTSASDWLVKFHSVCVGGGPVHRGSEQYFENVVT
ncbi:Zn ribbon nucleic-acid-binding protein [Variovorax sp. SG517]|uniref:TniQ family protein n=1 Tax=Variovorax sp. SG517 TaxID=2587117 RepID=UPI00159DAD2A|nr:TniQ family protein [Variovorax sp. SG517]NVM89648.1 Zn ribbon nucleic-acid-binding protein [Variovorax sp. SG517]